MLKGYESSLMSDQSDDDDQTKSYAFIDLDGFSEINNEHGHAFGDSVIDTIEEFGNEFVEDNGRFEREYGQGDEFLIILDGVSKDDAEDYMGDFLNQLEALNPKGVTVTASIGIAEYPEDGEDEDEVIDTADQAMLVAEDWGGNTIRVAGKTVSTEEIEVWFEDFMRLDEGDYIIIEMWLGDLPELRAGEIYNETKDMPNTNPNTNAVMSSTKYREPISGVVSDILEMDSSETRFKMNVKQSRLEEVDLR
jgi:diguanylate cyclase (GGDEF)-like protein